MTRSTMRSFSSATAGSSSNTVTVAAGTLGPQPLQVVLSLNFLSEQALEVGSSLPLKLLPERLRIFA